MEKEAVFESLQRLFEQALENSLGKLVGGVLYIYSADNFSFPVTVFSKIDEIAEELSILGKFNVIKLEPRRNKVSFLYYPDFAEAPHPALEAAVAVDLKTSTRRTIDFSKSHNPPILHRKELLVGPEHPKYADWGALTKAEESNGLYENTKIIGF